MVTYITGVPGAGKTYYAVYKIFSLKDKYSFIYTNIHLKQYPDNIKKLDWDNFYDIISTAYTMYLNKNTDEDINNFLKLYNYHNVFIIIDEAHNFLGKKDDVLIWWLTYHRHLYHDIFLITQNLDLIDRKYLSIGEVFIKAVQSTLRLAPKTFFYNKYPNYKMREKFETDKLPKKQEIFEKYTSGDTIRAKNILFKYFIYFFLFFLISVAFFLILQFVFFRKGNLKKDDNNFSVPTHKVTTINSNTNNINSTYNFNFNNHKFYIFYCPGKYCFYKNNKLSLNFLYFLIKKYGLTYYISSPYLYLRDNHNLINGLLSPFGTKRSVSHAGGVGGGAVAPLLVPNAR